MDNMAAGIGIGYAPKPLPNKIIFETRLVPDRQKTIEAGYEVSGEADFVKIIPAGSNGNMAMDRSVESWLKSCERVGDPFLEAYTVAYGKWKKDGEIPEVGTAIKTCASFSEAERSNLISAGVKTVEELAQADDALLKRIRIGAYGLQGKARSFLIVAENQGKATEEINDLRVKVQQLQAENENLREELRAFQSEERMDSRKPSRRRGRPPKVTVDEST